LVLPIVSVVQSRLVITPEALLIVPETMLPSKPFSDRTGPEKVVLAIANYLMHKLPISLCIVR
jgi:hypothetical protein